MQESPNVTVATGNEARRIANARAAADGATHYVFQHREDGRYLVTVTDHRKLVTTSIWEYIYSVS